MKRYQLVLNGATGLMEFNEHPDGSWVHIQDATQHLNKIRGELDALKRTGEQEKDYADTCYENERLRGEISQLRSTLAHRLQELYDAKWLIRNGEKHFGSLWRDATPEDINAVTRRSPPQEAKHE